MDSATANHHKYNVLLVEDEENIREVIELHLENLGLSVVTASTGSEGLKIIENRNDINLFVLDWMLPEVSGIELCKKIRTIRPDQPSVLMVTAKTDSDSIVQGLDAGADDYITKPFEISVFKARIKAQLRRSGGDFETDTNLLTYKSLKIDSKKITVEIEGELVKLTKSEFFLLKTLLSNPGHVFTRKQLISSISGEGIHVNGRTIDTHMVALRRKISPYNNCIETIRGIGYKFVELNP